MGCCDGWNNPLYREAVSNMVDRKSYRFGALAIGLAFSVAGLVNIVCGSLMLVNGASSSPTGEHLPWLAAAPIWGGAVSLLAGVFGVCVFPTAISLKSRLGLMYAFYGCTFATMGTSIPVVINSVNAHSLCTHSEQAECLPNIDLMVSLSLVSVVMACVTLSAFIGTMIWYGTLHSTAAKAAKCSMAVTKNQDTDGRVNNGYL